MVHQNPKETDPKLPTNKMAIAEICTITKSCSFSPLLTIVLTVASDMKGGKCR